MSGALPSPGARVAYRLAGQAHRQAHSRAREAGLSFGEWRVLDAVLDLTTTYSKLVDDEVARGDVARRAGLSADRTAKALAKLGRLGIVFYRPGLGAGNLSLVAVPPPGEKGDVYASAFGAVETPERGEKGDVQASSFGASETSPSTSGKGDVQAGEKATPYARA